MDDKTPPPGQRKRLISIILMLAILSGAGAAAWYYWEGQWYESTDNAYLTGNLVEVSAQISGTVVWIGPGRAGPGGHGTGAHAGLE